MSEKREITTILLAGGQSKRMGKDKAFLKLNGKTFFRIIIEKISKYSNQIIISTNKDKNLYLPDISDLTIHPLFVKDKNLYSGPLNGIISCIPYVKNKFIFIATCDTPLLNPDLIPFLLDKINNYDAVIPVINEKKQFLNTIYTKNALNIANNLYSAGKRSLYAWTNLLNVKEIHQKELEAVKNSLLSYWSINTPEDYTRLLDIWHKYY